MTTVSENLIKPISLREISFPVFSLGKRKPETSGSLVYYVNESFNLDTAETTTILRVVDDTNIPGKSLGIRRLQLKEAGAKLHRIRFAVYFLGDLVKYSTSDRWFIDNTGRVFKYKKTTRAKLVCRKIDKIISGEGGAEIILVQGLVSRFKTLYPIDKHCKYVGILEYNGGHIFYGAYEEPFKTTWRLV